MDATTNTSMNTVHGLLHAAEVSMIYHDATIPVLPKQALVAYGNHREGDRIVWYGAIYDEHGQDAGTFTFSLPENLLKEGL